MKCPICKKTIPNDSLKCPYCNSRTGIICKNCNTVNSVFDFICKNCGHEILKLCPECKSVNLPNVKRCRKCGHAFISNKHNNNSEKEHKFQLVSQKNAKDIIVKGILSNDKQIFSLSGEKGIGKTVTLKAIIQSLVKENFEILFAKCTPITQLTPGGLIQDIILHGLNFPNFCINNLQFKKDVSKFFKNEFPEFTNKEIFDLMNFLYPHEQGMFEDIVANKTKTFNTLNKLFDRIITNKFIFIIDNFDFVDGFSYEFLSKYLQKEEIIDKFKLLVLYNENKPAKGYFNFSSTPKEKDIYLDVGLAKLDYPQMEFIVEQKNKKIEGFPHLSQVELQEIYQISEGNPAYINHALDLRFDCQLSDQDFELSTTFKGLLELRLAMLAHINPIAYDILLGSAIIGDKINMNLVREIFEVKEDDFKDIMIYLNKMDYVVYINDIYCEFSSLLLWETILKTAKNDTNYNEINKKIFKHLSNFTLNSHAILGIIAQNLKQPELALDIWTKNTRLAAYIGDLNLYSISQKQSLALINEFDESQTLKIRYNISERLGKLLAHSNPSEAMEYLPDAISNAETKGEEAKEIELLAYLASCCRKTGNYFGEIECVDSVLKKVNPANTLDIALLKASKLSALLNIGNCGQIINMVDNEIMPVLDQYLNKRHSDNISQINFVYETWLKTYLILANALVVQGNVKSFEILTILFDIIERENIQDELFICKCKITLAFANTMKGNFEASEQMLEDVLKNYRENIMDSSTITRWNFINILNNVFKRNYSGIQEELFQIVTFANNHGDNFTKNILKAILGKVFKDKGNTKQAINIYNDQITYFAKEQMAVGALLTWVLLSDAMLITDGPDEALSTAEQALKVAQSPKIDNYFFSILLRMVIAKCSITTSDFETAKIQIETAIKTAKQFELNDLLSRLYILYGKYFQELGLVTSEEQTEYLKNAETMYSKAEAIVANTKNEYVVKELKKSAKSLVTFCGMNNIEL